MKLLLPPDANGNRNTLDVTARQLLIIGANGAGKTRFANYLAGELEGKAFRMSALEALYGSPHRREPLPGSIDALFRDMTSASPVFRPDISLQIDKLIALLLNDEIIDLVDYKVRRAENRKATLKTTRLDRVIKAWQSIFPSNRILIEGGRLLFIRDDHNPAYPSIRLSDGERATLYYLGSVLYAPHNATIFVDSPAMFLHPTVSNVIWDKIEEMRPDCTFVYTTHDLEFASSRTDSAVVWVREFDPVKMRWDYSLLPEHTGIPEDLYLSIIGARKPVMFIEGVAGRSIDYKLYSLIFPQFTVKSLGSCNKVIESVRSFNDLNGFHHLDSYGIVDRDRRDVKEVEYLRKKKILVPDVAEVENLLLLENVVKAVARSRRRDPEKVFAKVKNTMLKLFRGELTSQALQHTRHRVKRTVEFRVDGKFSDISMLEDHMIDLVHEINPRGIYKGLCESFTSMLDDKDYDSILRVFNDKTMLTNSNVAALCGLRNKEQYLAAILSILKTDSPEAMMIRSAIKEKLGVGDWK